MSESRSGLDDFLAALAARTATPGGGAAAGACGALACALAEMVAAYSVPAVDRSGAAGGDATGAGAIRNRLGACRRMLRSLMDEDAAAYAAMTLARREMKADAGRRPLYESAVLTATRVPMEIMAVSATSLSLMAELSGCANPHLMSDLAAAAWMALASARAADCSVRVNLPELPSSAAGDAATEADRILARAVELAAQVDAATRRKPGDP